MSQGPLKLGGLGPSSPQRLHWGVLQVDGQTANFKVHYEIDDDTSEHALALDKYGGDTVGSWVLLEPEDSDMATAP